MALISLAFPPWRRTDGAASRAALALALLACLLPARAGHARKLVFAYPERPPYHHTVDGRAAGVLVDLTARIAADAGFEPVFQPMPTPRIIQEMRQEDSTLCGFGWFKTTEREAFASFTIPFYRDEPLVAVILRGRHQQFAGKTSLRELAEDPALTLGLVASWTYGGVVEDILARAKARVVLAPERPRQARMLAAGRFDYTLARREEFKELAALAGLSQEDLLAIPLTDLRDQGVRYILCGRGVPGEVLERLNAAVLRNVPPPKD